MGWPVLAWVKEFGGSVLLVGGAILFFVLLALDLFGGMNLSFPFSLLWGCAGAMPAAGIAVFFLHARDQAALWGQRDEEG